MAQTILIKRSNTSGAVPTTSQLSVGELALNTRDGKIYMRKYVDGTTGNDTITLIGDTSTIAATTLTGNLSMGDNVRAIFGTGNDLQIYHDGSHSYIKDAGTGRLRFQSSTQIDFLNGAGTETLANFIENDAVKLYFNNAQKFSTTSTGIDVTGSVVADGLTVQTAQGNIEIPNSASQIDMKRAGTNYLYASHASGELSLGSCGSLSWLNIASNGDISFYDGSGNQGFFFDSSTSRLGLGTTVPSEKLHLQSSDVGSGSGEVAVRMTVPASLISAQNEIRSGVTGGTNPYMSFAVRETSAPYSTVEKLRINADGSSVFSGSVSAHSSYFTGNTGNTNNRLKLLYNSISGVADFGPDSSGGNTSLNIGTSSSGTFVNALSISSTQNVNIPNGSLMVGSTTAPTGLLSFQTSTAGNNTTHNIIDATTDNPTYKAQINLVREGSSGQLGWAFLTNSVGSPTERLRISHDGSSVFSGSVSVGGATPQGNLTIKGSASDDIDLLTFSEDGTNQSFSFNGNFAGTGSTGNSLSLDSYWQNDIMAWRGDGNVNIGSSLMVGSTTAPTSRLHIKAANNAYTGRILIEVTYSSPKR